MMKIEIVTQDALLKILKILDDMKIHYWLDGGWGVDVLAGKQARDHRDIDINFDAQYCHQLLDVLQSIGYEIQTDLRPVRIELYHSEFSYIDIHPFVLHDDGSAKQADLEGGWYEFEASFFTKVPFAGRMIPCISSRGQILFHTGYELRNVDKHDIKILNALLNIEE